MYRKLVLFFATLSLFSGLYSESQKIIDTNNEYGGKTVSRIIDEWEDYYSQFRRLDVYYDKNDVQMRRKYYFSPNVVQDIGYITQDEFLKNGKVAHYLMEFSDDNKYETDIDFVSETYDDNENHIEINYIKGNRYTSVSPESFTLRYPLCNIANLYQKLRAENNTDEFYFSRKFYQGRSFIKTTSDVTNLNAIDRENLRLFLKNLGASSYESIFVGKIDAISNGQRVVVYLQKNFVNDVENNMDMFLTYSVFKYRDKLYLVSSDFHDVMEF